MYTKAIEDLIALLMKFPGVGKRSAERMALVIIVDSAFSKSLELGINAVREKIKRCKICNNFSEYELCEICSQPTRRNEAICVVENPKDIAAIESSSRYKGKYHVIMGVLSPLDNIGPAQLNIDGLIQRVKANHIKEVIIATGSSAEGEATAYYIKDRLSAIPNIKITRIARGVPVGLDLEYVDKSSLAKALDNRTVF